MALHAEHRLLGTTASYAIIVADCMVRMDGKQMATCTILGLARLGRGCEAYIAVYIIVL